MDLKKTTMKILINYWLGSFIFCFLVIINTYATASDQSKITHVMPYSYYMKILLKIAKTQQKAPFAAMVVNKQNGSIVSVGLNNSRRNPLLHGEIVAMNNAIKKTPDINWKQMILITTAEPCAMCMSDIIWAGIPLTVYGTSIPYLKKQHWDQIDIRARDVIKKANSFYHGKIIGGVLHNNTDQLFIKKRV